MKLRPSSDIGTFLRSPDPYGESVLGRPLEVWRPSGECRLLIHAGIHGEEGETTLALSQALRTLADPSPHCAVVVAANPDGLARGTRGNAHGVDLNRNFPTADWRPDPVKHRSTLDAPREVALSPGSGPGSEPETQALIRLIDDLQPRAVVALHAPLACIDDAGEGPLARWIAEATGLPLVGDVGYPTPGSFGTWGGERGLPVVTYEFEMIDKDTLMKTHVPVLTELLAGVDPWS
jgi:protein MpaA